MLREVTSAVQHNLGLRRRWFTSAYFDLIVWYGIGDKIVGFELCYGKPTNERALSWSEDEGYAHFKVDVGESEPFKHKMAPVCVNDGAFDKHSVSKEFFFESLMLEREIRDYVLQKIDDCNLSTMN